MNNGIHSTEQGIEITKRRLKNDLSHLELAVKDEISLLREKVSDTKQGIESFVQGLSIPNQIQKRPITSLAVSVGAGLFLGRLFLLPQSARFLGGTGLKTLFWGIMFEKIKDKLVQRFPTQEGQILRLLEEAKGSLEKKV